METIDLESDTVHWEADYLPRLGGQRIWRVRNIRIQSEPRNHRTFRVGDSVQLSFFTAPLLVGTITKARRAYSKLFSRYELDVVSIRRVPAKAELKHFVHNAVWLRDGRNFAWEAISTVLGVGRQAARRYYCMSAKGWRDLNIYEPELLSKSETAERLWFVLGRR